MVMRQEAKDWATTERRTYLTTAMASRATERARNQIVERNTRNEMVAGNGTGDMERKLTLSLG
jgi:hypothetical protein